MSNNDSNRIVQIMPTNRGEAIIWDPNSKYPSVVPMVGWALLADGTVHGMVLGSDGTATLITDGNGYEATTLEEVDQ